MRIITTFILSIFALSATACPGPDLLKSSESNDKNKSKEYGYEDFLSSKNKKDFIEKQINNYPDIKNVIGQESCKVSKYKKITENRSILFLQVSCKGMDDNMHIIFPKTDVIDARINTCEVAKKKFGSYVVCKGKI
jgi:hypothetical protein